MVNIGNVLVEYMYMYIYGFLLSIKDSRIFFFLKIGLGKKYLYN